MKLIINKVKSDDSKSTELVQLSNSKNLMKSKKTLKKKNENLKTSNPPLLTLIYEDPQSFADRIDFKLERGPLPACLWINELLWMEAEEKRSAECF